MLLINLSERYDISLVEVYKPKEGKVFKNYTVNLKQKEDEEDSNEQHHFSSKRKLVSWLMCLKWVRKRHLEQN